MSWHELRRGSRTGSPARRFSTYVEPTVEKSQDNEITHRAPRTRIPSPPPSHRGPLETGLINNTDRFSRPEMSLVRRQESPERERERRRETEQESTYDRLRMERDMEQAELKVRLLEEQIELERLREKGPRGEREEIIIRPAERNERGRSPGQNYDGYYDEHARRYRSPSITVRRSYRPVPWDDTLPEPRPTVDTSFELHNDKLNLAWELELQTLFFNAGHPRAVYDRIVTIHKQKELEKRKLRKLGNVPTWIERAWDDSFHPILGRQMDNYYRLPDHQPDPRPGGHLPQGPDVTMFAHSKDNELESTRAVEVKQNSRQDTVKRHPQQSQRESGPKLGADNGPAISAPVGDGDDIDDRRENNGQKTDPGPILEVAKVPKDDYGSEDELDHDELEAQSLFPMGLVPKLFADIDVREPRSAKPIVLLWSNDPVTKERRIRVNDRDDHYDSLTTKYFRIREDNLKTFWKVAFLSSEREGDEGHLVILPPRTGDHGQPKVIPLPIDYDSENGGGSNGDLYFTYDYTSDTTSDEETVSEAAKRRSKGRQNKREKKSLRTKPRRRNKYSSSSSDEDDEPVTTKDKERKPKKRTTNSKRDKNKKKQFINLIPRRRNPEPSSSSEDADSSTSDDIYSSHSSENEKSKTKTRTSKTQHEKNRDKDKDKNENKYKKHDTKSKPRRRNEESSPSSHDSDSSSSTSLRDRRRGVTDRRTKRRKGRAEYDRGGGDPLWSEDEAETETRPDATTRKARRGKDRGRAKRKDKVQDEDKAKKTEPSKRRAYFAVDDSDSDSEGAARRKSKKEAAEKRLRNRALRELLLG